MIKKVFEESVKEKLKEGWTVTQIARFLRVSDIRVTRNALRIEKRELGFKNMFNFDLRSAEWRNHPSYQKVCKCGCNAHLHIDGDGPCIHCHCRKFEIGEEEG